MNARPAVRVMQARRSKPVACGHWVPVGSWICRVDGRWICLECRLDDIRAAPAGQEDRPAGSELAG